MVLTTAHLNAVVILVVTVYSLKHSLPHSHPPPSNPHHHLLGSRSLPVPLQRQLSAKQGYPNRTTFSEQFPVSQRRCCSDWSCPHPWLHGNWQRRHPAAGLSWSQGECGHRRGLSCCAAGRIGSRCKTLRGRGNKESIAVEAG